MRAFLTENKRKSAVGNRVQIDFEEINVKFTVDIMQFVFVPLGFGQIRRKFFEIVEIVRATSIDAFMDDKVFSVFLWHKRMTAVRAGKYKRHTNIFAAAKCSTAYFAQKLASAAVVVIYIMMGSVTAGTNGFFRYSFPIASGDRFQYFLVFP